MSESRKQSVWSRLAGPLRLVTIASLLVALVVILVGIPVLHVLAWIYIAFLALCFAIWTLNRLWHKLLWRVGRRLAFTYFLIGVLPIPMVALMAFVAAYLFSGFFLGHLFRDGFGALNEELEAAARSSLRAYERGVVADPGTGQDEIALAYYRQGRRVAGDARAPERWPGWLADEEAVPDQVVRRPSLPTLVAVEDRMSVAAATERDGLGVLAFSDGDLEAQLSRRSGIWVDLITAEDSRKELMTLQLFGESFVLQPLARPGAVEEREEFLDLVDPDTSLHIIGFELAGPLLSLEDGEVTEPSISATLTATPALVRRYLLSRSAEVDTLAWLGFILPAFLLFDVYAVAALLAVFLILGLSRAVNRLSKATRAVQAGDFSTRIPVRRRDQIGALQDSFNRMMANIEELLTTAAKKERLEKELEIARDLQKSLLPSELTHTESVAFSTFFEPSAAIGGDYFDILWHERNQGRRLAIFIADVSGHGLSAGLGMAMLKAALQILVEEQHEPDTILAALDRLVRSGQQKRFVTATLSLLDLETGELEITNAGHPPTYLLHDGKAQEIVLPSPPLGALGRQYCKHRIDLEPGDVVVWLSDGFIEATGADEESFGYERTQSALDGEAATPGGVRDRFLSAVRHHMADRVAEDDCTLVVMRYDPVSRPVKVTAVAEVVAR